MRIRNIERKKRNEKMKKTQEQEQEHLSKQYFVCPLDLSVATQEKKERKKEEGKQVRI